MNTHKVHWQLHVCNGTALILLAWQGLVTNSVHTRRVILKDCHEHGSSIAVAVAPVSVIS